ncbi:hypothetical protein AUEXF2481DRAFT_90446 [Aureobasidium subglaciale EXF-2481]|uniref:Prokaryotic-type class I peptide chain release factors domain-containing protein n=1 Tax=Aureobasidium subglaciale (strain EXF-2481) TaxID=1043005 RepID=A0A074Y7E2_AURSE|nr:uncharacterized protein AUEXF2481DRAFT_90446 [Aureobasidium subglaciale EXF-2481]KAI5212949.1 hypothetical protein E4T38_00002 [Aureobasidium subglaciale]KAI5232623.1 hypothetical protein E4T40_00002 [Aureobasidium subglaciale]KAI5234738.1 hypothetical protein E4T41_00002 [Aureobasidium subglaciale]KAI5268399.1 hypothetical protein E4T46_00002 [Aureobasidium subglaciale]KEQ93693.1 hypothetical protein AUEXF2481DRAFT_90446 [Aureobasidium subglaciale EXF-2481]
MFRSFAILRPKPSFVVTRTPTSFCTSARSLAAIGVGGGENSGGGGDDELDAARRWLANFNAETIPRNICDVSFSRSSGPGGQNVNKVNSKATLRLPLSALLPMLPVVLRPAVSKSRFSAKDDLVIQADDSRKQAENVHRCFIKLHEMIVQVGREVVPGETSAEQVERVKKLQKAENEGRLKMKKKHSDKKSARRGGGKPDY